MTQQSIFVVDDEETIREGLFMALEGMYQVEVFETAEDALKGAQNNCPDLVLLDIGLPGMSGVDALQQFKSMDPSMVVIMVTAYENIDTVVRSMKLGAYDYVVKPIQPDSLMTRIANGLESNRLRREVRELQEQRLVENMPFFVGESDVMQDVMEFLTKVARSPDTPILVVGETGTGKELIANAIHHRSPHHQGPLITVNCPAIPKDLIESELFGYERGAFTGARASGKKGLLEESQGGTLFLDEIGDLSLEAQSKLLRFLEEGEFYKIGGTRQIKIQTRVVSATNRDLQEMMDEGSFRRDLFYRLSVIQVRVPPLNERPRDVALLADYFMHKFAQKFERRVTGLTREALQLLKNHRWVGNVRELKNMIERAVLVCDGPQVSAEDLFPGPGGAKQVADEREQVYPPLSAEGVDLSLIREDLERHYIEEAYRLAEGNESKAAGLLKMNHHTYRYHRKKLNEK